MQQRPCGYRKTVLGGIGASVRLRESSSFESLGLRLECRLPDHLAIAEGPEMSSVRRRFGTTLFAHADETDGNDDYVVPSDDEVLRFDSNRLPLLSEETCELANTFMATVYLWIKDTARNVIDDIWVEEAVVRLTGAVVVVVAAAQHRDVFL